MNIKLVLKLTGKTLMVAAATMLLPLFGAIYYGEPAAPFAYSILLLIMVGYVLTLPRVEPHFFAREGFFSVGLIWVLFGVFGALPFWFSGYFDSFVDCVFEAISGFTTTGASILTAVECLPKSILLWRSFTHWLGGMGVLILTIALLPSLGVRSTLLVRAETPGPVVTKLVPKASQSSKILYGIYFALTVIQVIFLRFTGMPMFDCLVNSFATAGTGGFSVKNLSIGAYASPSAEIIITIFMLLFSLNFAVYFLMLRGKFKQAVESDELKFFVSVVFISTTLISFNIRSFYDTFGEALRSAAFQVASIISTTGFSSADFNLWPELSRTILILLMFCGACAGSTGGAIKCSRVLVVFRYIGRELKQISHPRSVNVVRLDGHVVDEDNLKNIMAFFGAYIFISLGATLLISLDNYSFGTSFTAVVACIGNVGPGLELVGPMGNYSMFSPLSKLVLSLCMVIGRLEIFPILMLLSPKSWHA